MENPDGLVLLYSEMSIIVYQHCNKKLYLISHYFCKWIICCCWYCSWTRECWWM